MFGVYVIVIISLQYMRVVSKFDTKLNSIGVNLQRGSILGMNLILNPDFISIHSIESLPKLSLVDHFYANFV